MRNAIRHFPARPLTPNERSLLANWLATAGDVASAYIVQRRSDDPTLLYRIVIAAGTDDVPSHVVHAASGRDVWIVSRPGLRTRIRRYRTLQAALNSIRSVFTGGDAKGYLAKSEED
jgi:hypothetical protein